MGAFHIEDDWYLVPDEYSWNLAKKVEFKGKDFKTVGYCNSPENALQYFLKLKQSEVAQNASDGDLTDLMRILSSETNRLRERLKSVFKEACEIDFDEPLETDEEDESEVADSF